MLTSVSAASPTWSRVRPLLAPDHGAPHLARKPNYGFEKRKKELDRQAKKLEKLRRKRELAEERARGPADPEAEEGATPPLDQD